MDIPVNAEVYCSDGRCGHSTYIIVNPVSRKVTHLVVKEKQAPHTERLVPIKLVTETTHDRVRLGCSQDELSRTEPFAETEYIRDGIPDYEQYEDTYLVWPYRVPDVTKTVSVRHKRVPHGELAVQRGARVHASNGRIGHVDEFLVAPEDGHITHLILREGHLWGQKDVAIPISEIERIEENKVYLKLNKRDVGKLPVIPIRRR
jgi:sporulation protein YlmC with PRC-barrel domain